jgi:quinol monooxygenase YgiN
MSKVALYAPLEAKPDKEKEVADFLKSALPLVNAEPGCHLVCDPGRSVVIRDFRHVR